jgi:hypothetical protein
MRRGELLALPWQAVDFQAETFNARKSIWQQHLGLVKTRGEVPLGRGDRIWCVGGYRLNDLRSATTSVCVKLLRLLVRAAWGRAMRPVSQEKRRFWFSRSKQRRPHGVRSFLFAAVRQGRSDQGSSPCSTQPRSPSQTPASSRHRHRLLRLPGAESSNRRQDRRACRST